MALHKDRLRVHRMERFRDCFGNRFAFLIHDGHSSQSY